MRRLVLAFTAALTTLAVAAALAGCSGGSDTATNGDGAGSAADRNAADVAFAKMMIPYHQQAVGMAKLAASRAADPAVKELAAQIDAAQTPEITTMTGWLAAWGEPTATAPGMPAISNNGPGIPGEVSPAFMAALTAASGATFDMMFLEMMVRQHEGAVETARTERRDGTFGPATQLAATIETTDTNELATMQRLLHKK